MMSGEPATRTYLVPQKSREDSQTYHFDRGDGERWLWCSYGGAGGVQLARKLDPSVTSCTVSIKNKKPENTLSAAVTCK